jgi:acyl carrier protein
MDKVVLFNELVKVVKPVSAQAVTIDTLDVEIQDTGLDSLDSLMFGVYMGDIYGVPEETFKEFQFKTVKEMFDLFEQHATKTPASLEEALENCK